MQWLRDKLTAALTPKLPTPQQLGMAIEVVNLKEKALSLGLYRTARMLEIAIQEIGWELQGVETPKFQQNRQVETLNIQTHARS
jgi:hypothetical protein